MIIIFVIINNWLITLVTNNSTKFENVTKLHRLKYIKITAKNIKQNLKCSNKK